MILETAVLDIKPGMQGYINHQLQKCLEVDNRYLLLVNWQTLEHHTQGFRHSPEYLHIRVI